MKIRRLFSAIALSSLLNATPLLAFDTVINVPPEVAPSEIGSSTQLNLGDGGVLPFNFQAGASDGSSTDVEVNIDGGMTGRSFDAYFGSTINVYDGGIDQGFLGRQGSFLNIYGGIVSREFETAGTVNLSGGILGSNGSYPSVSALQHSQFNISGGTVLGGLRASAESEVHISGGTIGRDFIMSSGSVITIEGGLFGGHFDQREGSDATLIGGEFRLNGIEYTGSTISLDPEDIFTGTLANGTPFLFTPHTRDSLSNIALTQATLPAADITTIVVDESNSLGPRGLRAGQSLELRDGGTLTDYFVATEATLRMDGGLIGDDAELYASKLEFNGGTIGRALHAFGASHISVNGGSMLTVKTFADSSLDMQGGTITHLEAHSGSNILIAGGTIGSNSNGSAGSSISISGGTVPHVGLEANGELHLYGTEFLLDGQPITGLALNTPITIETREGFLSGVFADGTPFSFELQGNGKLRRRPISPGATLTVTLVNPVPEPATAALTTMAFAVFLGCRWHRRKFCPPK